MKYIKLTLFILLLCLLSDHTMAQRTEHHSGTTESDKHYSQGIGWVRSPLPDNWYFQIQAGGNLYYGFEDRTGDFKDRVQPLFEGYIGRWVFPMLGFRVGVSYHEYAGFITKDSYLQYKPTNHGHGYQQYFAPGSSDYSTFGPNLGGYYWNYDNNGDLFTQRWRAFSLTPDLMVHISNFAKYDPNRRFNTLAYIGAGFHIVPPKDDEPISPTFNSNGEPSVDADGHYTGPVTVSWGVDPNMDADFHLGLIEKIRLGRHFELYADARFSMLGGTFDREKVEAVERGIRTQDYMFQVVGGVSYNFNWRSREKQLAWYKEHIDSTFTDADNVPQQIYTSHEVKINILTYIDTIYTYDTISEFSAQYDTMLMRKIREHAGHQIDSVRAAFDRDCHEYTLDDILGKGLLPYEMVFFDLDKWDIRSSENVKIAKMASVMNAFPNYHFLLIGSADSKTGTVKRNQLLSTNRSDVIYNKLVYEYDVNPDQLKRVYMGGILDFDPYELNRATVIIMDHPKVMEEFEKLRADRKAGGSQVEWNE